MTIRSVKPEELRKFLSDRRRNRVILLDQTKELVEAQGKIAVEAGFIPLSELQQNFTTEGEEWFQWWIRTKT